MRSSACSGGGGEAAEGLRLGAYSSSLPPALSVSLCPSLPVSVSLCLLSLSACLRLSLSVSLAVSLCRKWLVGPRACAPELGGAVKSSRDSLALECRSESTEAASPAPWG